MNWYRLQEMFKYDPQGGDQDLQANIACGGEEVIYYLFIRRSSSSLELVRIGEVDDTSVDRTVNLGHARDMEGGRQGAQGRPQPPGLLGSVVALANA